ncbi:MAG: ZIP family metal transporter [Candidatus Diapherotrites archaeon]|nr:ZIP family metal transporter [Candidatus Diapherotrites archaeon]
MLLELFASLFIISLTSLVGLVAFGVRQKTLEKYLDLMVGFAAGALLGDAFIHLLPELGKTGITASVSFTILFGIVVFFVLEKVVHWHHCHRVHHENVCTDLPYMSLAGDILHNIIDGVILAGAFIINPVIGFSTALAIFIHELPHEGGNYSILIKGGFSRKKALLANFITALASFIGAILTLALSALVSGLMPYILAFSIGSFIYIGGTDLLPELHKKFTTKKAILETIAIILGIAAMGILLLLE